MAARIEIIRGATEKELEEKKFNVYFGISLGNKWFTEENIKEYILWAIKYTKSRVGILIADRLHTINYQVMNDESLDKALKKALRKGNEIESMIREITDELPQEKKLNIDIVRWGALENDSFHKKCKDIFYEEFRNNLMFREEILDITRSFLKNNKRKFSKDKIEELSRYVIEEFPDTLNGFDYKGTRYNLEIYPQDNLLFQLIEKIQKKQVFPEIRDKIQLKNKISVVLEIL